MPLQLYNARYLEIVKQYQSLPPPTDVKNVENWEPAMIKRTLDHAQKRWTLLKQMFDLKEKIS